MSNYLGDFRASKMVRFMWNSNAVAGESITRATNGTISVYKDASNTQTTTGVSDTEDVDSLTGVHRCSIDTAADGTFYAEGSDFMVVLSAATIDGKVINAVLAQFSLANRSPLRPTTVDRTLNVNTNGDADANLVRILGTLLTETAGNLAAGFKKWFNVASPTGTVNSLPDAVPDNSAGLPTVSALATTTDFNDALMLAVPNVAADPLTVAGKFVAVSAVKVKTDQLVFSTANRVDSQVFGMEQGVITAAVIASNAIGAAELAADGVTEIQANMATAAALATAQTALTSLLARLPAALSGAGNMKSDLLEINDSATLLSLFAAMVAGGQSGVATTGTLSMTQMSASALPSVADNQYSTPVQRLLLFTSGVLKGTVTQISAYTDIGRILTFNAVRTPPSNGDLFIIL